jgi:uncharacterized RDD family membrane protein YckC
MTNFVLALGFDLFSGLLSFMAIIWVLAIALTIFWIWALVDALINEPTTNEKLLWFLVIFLLHFIGAIIYLAVRRGHRRAAL